MKLSYIILFVKEIQQSIDFYQNALDLKHKFTHEGNDYAEMQTGETTLAFCTKELAESNIKAKEHKVSQSDNSSNFQLTFSPSDLKQAYQKALENGAISISPPEIKPWNFEVALIKDPDGHLIELAKNLNKKV